MKEIKACVRQSRIAALLQALREAAVSDANIEACCQSISVMQVLRPLINPEPIQQHYSMDLAEPVINAYRIELICADELVGVLTDIISQAAHTGQPEAGWIVVTDLQRSETIL